MMRLKVKIQLVGIMIDLTMFVRDIGVGIMGSKEIEIEEREEEGFEGM
jgi:hypothetical protein